MRRRRRQLRRRRRRRRRQSSPFHPPCAPHGRRHVLGGWLRLRRLRRLQRLGRHSCPRRPPRRRPTHCYKRNRAQDEEAETAPAMASRTVRTAPARPTPPTRCRGPASSGCCSGPAAPHPPLPNRFACRVPFRPRPHAYPPPPIRHPPSPVPAPPPGPSAPPSGRRPRPPAPPPHIPPPLP